MGTERRISLTAVFMVVLAAVLLAVGIAAHTLTFIGVVTGVALGSGVVMVGVELQDGR